MTTDDQTQKTFAILGASGGIGSEIARKIAQHEPSARLFLGARDSDKLDAISQSLEGIETEVVSLDATDFEESAQFIKVASEAGQLTGVYNCVGSILLKPAHLTTREDFDQIIAQNLASSFGVVRGVAKHALKSKASVVLYASAAASVGLSNHEAIAAAKAGVVGLARSAATTYARYGLRFNVLAPGLVETKMSAAITENKTARASSEALHPLARLGQPEEVAALSYWLTSADATWVTGQCWGIDGGLATLKTPPKKIG